MTNNCPCCGRVVSDPEWHEYHRHEDCWIKHFVKQERPEQVQLTPSQREIYEEVKAMQVAGKPRKNPIKKLVRGTGNIRVIPSSLFRTKRKVTE